MNNQMITKPDPNRHDASRPAFVKKAKSLNWDTKRDRTNHQEYLDDDTDCAWIFWQAALDWRDEQVCE